MSWAYPTNAPTGWKVLVPPTGSRLSMFTTAQTPTWSIYNWHWNGSALDQPSTSGVDGYKIWDVTSGSDTPVSQGSLSPSSGTFTPTAPAGGWKCGIYRIQLTYSGANDANFGQVVGGHNFMVMRDDANMIPNSATNTPSTGTSGGVVAYFDHIMRGVTVMGPPRLDVSDLANLGSTVTNLQNDIAILKTWYTQSGHTDSARPRPLFIQLTNSAVDVLNLSTGEQNTHWNNGNGWFAYAASSTVNPSQVFVQTSAGTTTGTKIQVFSPNSTTLVETWDNIKPTAVDQSLTPSSAYVRVFNRNTTGAAPTVGPLAIAASNPGPRAAGLATVVNACYPDVVYYESFNEPDQSPSGSHGPVETTHCMKLFQQTLHGINANAKTLGPCNASLNSAAPGGWLDKFFAAGGGAYCDAISTHPYSSGMVGQPTSSIRAINVLTAALSRYSLSSLAMWITEGERDHVTRSTVYHPRRTIRQIMVDLLAWDQAGIPKEQNCYWYDQSHGSWDLPCWHVNMNGFIQCAYTNPGVLAVRCFSEEVFGKQFYQKLTFAAPGSDMYVGNVYRNSTDDTRLVAIEAGSNGLGNVILTTNLTAGTSVTVSDWAGNLSTLTVDANSRLSVPTSDLPTYVRLPAATTVSVYTFGTWPTTPGTDHLPLYPGHGENGNAPGGGDAHIGWIADGTIEGPDTSGTPYPGTVQPSIGYAAPPCTLTWRFDNAAGRRVDRVLIFCGFMLNQWGALTDFDVQTTTDGTTWTTQATITATPPASILDPSATDGPGHQYMTLWDDRNIFDVPLPSIIDGCLGIRLNVRAASYGSHPDGDGGNPPTQPIAVVNELEVFCNDNARGPEYVFL